MSFIVTLVSSSPEKPVGQRHIDETRHMLRLYDIVFTCEPIWLEPGKAVDMGVSARPEGALRLHLMDFLAKTEIDLFITSPDRRRKKLLLADMDSTIIDSETLDELAAHAGAGNGLGEKIAAITALAMEGKLDFPSALRERVALLEGLPASALPETLQKMALNPGAKTFISTMKKSGAKCVLVSGGFTFFTGAIGKMCGFDAHHGNILGIENEKLNGKVEGAIVDKSAKFEFLKSYARELKIKPEDALAIGDGANDIPMLKAAGLGIGYKPKNAVKDEIDNLILYGDLTAALYAQGFTGRYLA